MLYHQDMCEALGEDAALELCDWCYRRLLHLSTYGREHAAQPGRWSPPHAAFLALQRVPANDISSS